MYLLAQWAPAWISNYIHFKESGEITYPFSILNGAAAEVGDA